MARWKLMDEDQIGAVPKDCPDCPFAYQNTVCKLYRKSVYAYVRKETKPPWCTVISLHVRMAVVDQAVLGGQRSG